MVTRYRRSAFWSGGIAVALVVTVYSVFATDKAPDTGTDDPVPALPVETMGITLEDGYERKDLFSGLVQPRRDSVLGFELGGRLAKVYVDEGETVEEGDPLAVLDTERLKAQRAEFVASVAEAEAGLALARATLSRVKGVVQAGGVSRQELDTALKGERAAEAALELARRRVATIDTELDKSILHAPFSGTIVVRFADEGRVVGVGAPVLQLQSDTPPEIRIGIGSSAVNELRTKNVYTLEWQGKPLRARLDAVLPLRTMTTRTVDALFEPLETPADMRPGDLVTLRLVSRIAVPGTWLPITVLTEGERGLWSVYLAESVEGQVPKGLSATHRVTRRTVDLIYQETDRVYIGGSLTPADRIVVTGVQRVVPEQWVRVFPDAAVWEAAGDE